MYAKMIKITFTGQIPSWIVWQHSSLGIMHMRTMMWNAKSTNDILRTALVP